MSLLLASVANRQEIASAINGGAAIIDCKNPADGALGPWSTLDLSRAVATVRVLERLEKVKISAALGSFKYYPDRLLLGQVRTLGAVEGIDLFKIGVHNLDQASLSGIKLIKGYLSAPLVVVIFGDEHRSLPIDMVAPLAATGIVGIMVDTANKHSGTLIDYHSVEALVDFHSAVRRHSLSLGIAGSLRLADLPVIVGKIGPDIIGLRGGLCCDSRNPNPVDRRCSGLQQSKVEQAMALLRSPGS